MTRHRWSYAGVDPYVAKWRICQRCAAVGRTYGAGAGRVWDYLTADGRRTLGKVPPCEPVPGLPAGWRVEVHRMRARPSRAPRWAYSVYAGDGQLFSLSSFRYGSEERAREAGVKDAAVNGPGVAITPPE